MTHAQSEIRLPLSVENKGDIRNVIELKNLEFQSPSDPQSAKTTLCTHPNVSHNPKRTSTSLNQQPQRYSTGSCNLPKETVDRSENLLEENTRSFTITQQADLKSQWSQSLTGCPNVNSGNVLQPIQGPDIVPTWNQSRSGSSQDPQSVHIDTASVTGRTGGSSGTAGQQHAEKQQRPPYRMDGTRYVAKPLETHNQKDPAVHGSNSRTNSSTYKSDLGPSCEEKMASTLHKQANDYESLEKSRPSSQHLYRPAAETSNVPLAKSASDGINSVTKSEPSPGATSSQYDTFNDNGSLESRPFLKPNLRGKKQADSSDVIIELQNDINVLNSSVEGQNKINARKANPEVPDVPNTNFAIACMVALCFNLPFGILAMYFSLQAVKAYQAGQSKKGAKQSRWSIVLSLLGITFTTVIISSVVLYIAMQGQKRISSRQRAYGGL